jgi:outer membrane protein assembly factor BamA
MIWNELDFNVKCILGKPIVLNGIGVLHHLTIDELADIGFNIYNNFIEGALFADGGNIWRIKEDGREGAVFNLNTFYKQLAIGGGIGLRLNLDFLIVRFDAAVPFVDPRRPEGNRVVLNEYSDLRVLFSKTILNFGVGYPF